MNKPILVVCFLWTALIAGSLWFVLISTWNTRELSELIINHNGVMVSGSGSPA